MRRLLDVAWRKNPDKPPGHFIVKKIPRFSDASFGLGELSRFLEEQHANELGLNVIWVDTYDELPMLSRQTANP